MRFVFLLGITLIHYSECDAPDAQMKQRPIVDLCEARGGVPIVNDLGDNILRCDFPLHQAEVEKR